MKEDFKKSLDSYKSKKGIFRIIEVPTMQYLMIDGRGDPNTSADYKRALEALYPVAYKLKFASKKQLGKDYTVMPLEALWWADDMRSFTEQRDKSKWHWTVMIMQPDWITQALLEEVREGFAEIGNPAFSKIRLETLTEGLSVQTLHVGSFDDEAPVLTEMHEEFIPSQHLKLAKKHHEIYLSDFRKVESSKLRTILRQPVVRE